eukprot:symbB.v1.2.020392.t1/scaffold1715.1/size104970/2
MWQRFPTALSQRTLLCTVVPLSIHCHRSARCDTGSAASTSSVGGPRRPVGRWRLDASKSESMRPYLTGLGMPGFVAGIIDRIPVELHISVEEGVLTVKDKTFFGENSTIITLGGEEVEKETRNKRKKFMLSAFESAPEASLTVKCRLFQRGDGWSSLQSFSVDPEGALQERYILKRPESEDVVVTRFFYHLGGLTAEAEEERGAAKTAYSGAGGKVGVVTGVGLLAILIASCCWSQR